MSANRLTRLLASTALAACVGWPTRAADAAAQAAPAELLTRAERSDFRETSSYEEVMQLSQRLAERGSDVHMTTFGYTNEGRALPLLVIGAPDATPEAVLATGKTRVYLQGNIHAGEVCGKEALLMLVRRHLEGAYPAWSRELVLLVAPIYNADGNERVSLRNRPLQHGPVGGMGQRPNAQGLDLNRDHMKLDSPEARAFVRLMSDYDPHVTVDLHTTNGTLHAYHLTYSPPLHPNTPTAIDALLRERWLPRVTSGLRDRDGWEAYYYGNLGPGGRGWYTFDHRPRFNNNYVGLRNRVAILSEAYAYLTFEERVQTTLRFAEEVLDFAAASAAEVRRVVEQAEAEPVVGRRLATRADFERSPEDVEILLGGVEEERHPGTGLPMLRRLDVQTPTRMYEYGTFRPTETETAPEAYYVLASATDVIERLEAHGVRTERLATARTLVLERFQIDSTAVAANEFQGRFERTVWGTWSATDETLPAGTVRVPVDQPLGRLAFSLLEPRSDDGLVAWALLDEEIEAGMLPVLRAPAG
ncbi:MAG TPA: M14 family metallopeptidase [Longimicrobiales bacterium]|nr:M14 family metallopeptidase [Longimicrobiales bacterium]